MSDQDDQSSGQKTPEELEAEIALQREQLAGTVDDLAAKLDVKSQAQEKVASLKDSATTVDGKPRPEVLAAAGSLVAMIVVLVVWRIRRDH
ncbi:DUF3618 domain-containing protein [Nocardioides renjunii]|uniref:DUF3618 domain-containing protein n=1 Tax=Nocardioides renjunii TaxID=3095075 RepID=UPI002AFF2CA7|nr:DUF3618 domain-containing protein [Nocardioides sp. S-34]WQQ23813.1 DUF3618 domain-containing protein [Nocardioides sp. S-34]